MNNSCFRKRSTFLKADLLPIRVTTLLTIGMVTLTSASTFAQRIQLNVRNQPVKTVLQQIEEQSGYSFIYDSKILANGRSINLDLDAENIDKALANLATQLNVDYSIVNKTVTLTNKKEKQLEDITVFGKVYLDDLEGGALRTESGVSLLAKTRNKSVTTNNNGEFKLVVPKGTPITISYVGYVSQTIKAETLLSNGKIVLEKSTSYLDEVIVTAYGKKEVRENQTGSAYMVTSKDFENKPALRLDALLEGIVPGVEFQSQDGGTNSSARPRFSTRVRGDASALGGATSNEPLWVIDGVPLYTGSTTNAIPGVEVSISPLTYLDLNDIESVTVLKDASATTIYGANGSNGVILVTTKRGKGTPQLNYSFRGGFDNRSKTNFRYLDGPQYLSIVKRMGLEDQLGNIDPRVNTYWPDYYYRTGTTLQHNISVSGAKENTSYYLSGNVFDQKSMTIGNTTKRYSLRTTISTDISRILSLNGGVTAAYTADKLFNPGSSFYQYSPLIEPFGRRGEYIERDPNGRLLQYMPGLADQNDHKQKAVWIMGNFGFSLRLLDGLSFVNRNGFDISSVNEDRYLSMYNHTGASSSGIAYRNQNQVINLMSSNILGYNKSIFGGEFDVMIGTEARQVDRNSVSAKGSGFPNDNIRQVSFVAEDNRTGTTSRAKNTELSYFGRVGYVYGGRYALDVTMRKDGSSNFGRDVKWGTFKSLGAAWTVHNESFWPENEIVDFLKIKASYGNNGNSRFSSSYANGVYAYQEDNSYGGHAGAIMTRGVNPGLKWENTNMFNTGLDFGLFNKFNIALEYYNNITHDMIDDSYVSMVGGFRSVYQNVGKVQNQGLELTVKSNGVNFGKFSWNATAIISSNRNKVLKLSEGVDISSGNSIMREGYNSKSFYLVRWAGVDPSTGDPMWYDANGNITKTFNTNNRVIVGNPTPNFYGGLTNNFTYGDFALSIFIKYSKGGYTLDQMGRSIGQDGLNILDGNQSINVLNAWYLPGYLSSEPRLSNISNSSIMTSSRYLLDKTYLALDNVSLSYRLPQHIVERIKLSNMTFTAMASKLALWSPYSGKKGTARSFQNMEGFEFLKDTKYLYNTYAEMFDSNSRISNYSFSVSVRF
ncbi:TonB-linked outer membrane protein, SusC/RagA family [Sphingobacterium nematocida]|uniref:TonB-linked outer membrane protein, SusC/RagA family n=1 Tax=Sphingobacterium nematocida TaxID=1513896 RepID=A0A1T5B1V4_9SPHI|nr:SusC/RagA family TonB-linked outer membrane protein [Sphingobacterium nematocida]SKB40960.1 TonB-linked outer membrane protein, SusC/RagA family [Sphingobacterium nematocida]